VIPSYRVNLTFIVADHLQEIFRYIEKGSPQNAAKTISRILQKIDGLEIFPHRYKLISPATSDVEELRSMPVRPYIVRYHINESTRVVTVVSVTHGARDTRR
jgi:plasmid stabilization system protein ParE